MLLDKPSGITSNAALQRVKRALSAERAGHTGTLDPLASGLLPIALGEATKYAADALDADKGYAATLHLGVRTSTGDAEGEVLETRPVDGALSRARLLEALARFTGRISQTPPMYSALKRDGRPLYEYARAGQTVERAPREVIIHRIELNAFAPPVVALDVDCSKGTYIRTLAEDIGAALGCGAHLAALCRTRVGAAGLARAITLAAFEALEPAARLAYVLPVDDFLIAYPIARIGAEDSIRLLNGRSIAGVAGSGAVRVYESERFLGLGRVDEAGVLHPVRLVRTDKKSLL